MSTNRRPEQLSLLPPSAAPLRFRLDQQTRAGLAHVAEIRRQLATMGAPHRDEQRKAA